MKLVSKIMCIYFLCSSVLSFAQNDKKTQLTDELTADLITDLNTQSENKLLKYYLKEENIKEVTSQYCKETTQGYKDSSATFLLDEGKEFSSSLMQFYENMKQNGITFNKLILDNKIEKEKLNICNVIMKELIMSCKDGEKNLNIKLVVIQIPDKIFLVKKIKIKYN